MPTYSFIEAGAVKKLRRRTESMPGEESQEINGDMKIKPAEQWHGVDLFSYV
jgi:hypothetical protein